MHIKEHTNRHTDTEAEFSTFVPNIGSFSWQARVVSSYLHLEGLNGEPVYGNSVRQNNIDTLSHLEKGFYLVKYSIKHAAFLDFVKYFGYFILDNLNLQTN